MRGKRLIVYLTVNAAAKRPEISPTQAWRNERRLMEPGASAAILGARASFVVWTNVWNTARPDVGPRQQRRLGQANRWHGMGFARPQRSGNATGNNADHIEPVIDAMDLMDKGNGFCLAGFDRDSARIAPHLCENGIAVCGFGEQKPPEVGRRVAAGEEGIFEKGREALRSCPDASSA